MTTEEFVNIIGYINTGIGVLLWLCIAYRFFYLAVPFFKKIPVPSKTVLHRYAILISARNEEQVIPHLLQSIAAQNYPRELISVFVCADNCTDATAEVCRKAGATVYERFDTKMIGKGYAMNYLLGCIRRDFGWSGFDGFLVIDADNLLAENYLTEMNRTFSQGYRVITSYRNTKNYGDNWISSGYALWFLHEAKYLNYSRAALGTSCAVSGTGFLFSRDILEKAGNWNFFLLTEDIEFTIWNVLDGETIGYCPRAVIYDEQPTSFRQSWRQRLRWGKGYIQVFRKYGTKLIWGMFRKKGFACYDMAMSILPAVILTALSLVLNTVSAVITLAAGGNALPVIFMLAQTLAGSYGTMFLLGILPLITEWKNIRAERGKKLLSLFTFPLFMMTYIPISFVSLFARVEWKPIEHSRAMGIDELK